jgi:hypothetical protein
MQGQLAGPSHLVNAAGYRHATHMILSGTERLSCAQERLATCEADLHQALRSIPSQGGRSLTTDLPIRLLRRAHADAQAWLEEVRLSGADRSTPAR